MSHGCPPPHGGAVGDSRGKSCTPGPPGSLRFLVVTACLPPWEQPAEGPDTVGASLCDVAGGLSFKQLKEDHTWPFKGLEGSSDRYLPRPDHLREENGSGGTILISHDGYRFTRVEDLGLKAIFLR